jgi:hypothetical protein
MYFNDACNSGCGRVKVKVFLLEFLWVKWSAIVSRLPNIILKWVGMVYIGRLEGILGYEIVYFSCHLLIYQFISLVLLVVN